MHNIKNINKLIPFRSTKFNNKITAYIKVNLSEYPVCSGQELAPKIMQCCPNHVNVDYCVGPISPWTS